MTTMTADEDVTAEVQRLRRQLAEAEQTIKALAGAEIDAIALGETNTPILLHRAQEDLRQREQLLRAMFEGVGDGILLVDSEGAFLDANSTACELFGAAKSEVIGRRTEDFAAPGYDVAAERQQIVARGQHRGQITVALRDGSVRELEYSATRDILPGLHLSVLRDVTSLNQARDALLASEKKYRQIVDTAREGIWVIDAQSRTTFANRALEEMLGYGPGELLGRSVLDFVDAETRARTEEGLERRRRGVAELQEQKYQHKDGSVVWVLMEASPMTDDAGMYAGALAMVTNVTDRKRAEEALRASEERYRLLFDSCPLPIWLTDLGSWRFLAVNQAALALFGYERAEFLGLDISRLVPGSEVSRVQHEIQASVGRGVQHGTRRALKKNGTAVELSATAQTFVLDGRVVALVIGQDMTERNRLEAQLSQSRKMEAIGILAGGVAHDFNNLLSIIVTYTAFALEALKPGEPVHADVVQVAQAGERAVALTRQLLAFSRQKVLEPTVMDLNATLLAIEPNVRRMVGEKVDVSFVLEPALGRISADPWQIEQVILNLVENAADATVAAGTLTITTGNVRVAEGRDPSGPKSGEYVRLAVTDTGTGMDEATRARIFEPFFSTKEAGEGTGLGLSTVLGIAQQSGGHVAVRSEQGVGTTFEVHLPRIDL